MERIDLPLREVSVDRLVPVEVAGTGMDLTMRERPCRTRDLVDEVPAARSHEAGEVLDPQVLRDVLGWPRRLSGHGDAAEVGVADDRDRRLALEEESPDVLHQVELASRVRRIIGVELSRVPRRPGAPELVQETRRVVRVGQESGAGRSGARS